MKILRVQVNDPGRLGYANSPKLDVFVDSEPESTSELIQHDVAGGYYLSRHYGPFVKFLFYNTVTGSPGACGGHDGWPGGAWTSRAGAFNVEVKPAKQVMDVTLYVEGDSLGYAGWSLEVDRAHRELKKHEPEWLITTDDQAALMGDITWSPQERIPSCLWRGTNSPSNAAICGKAAFYPYMHRPLGLCDQHKTVHDQNAARIRAEYASKYGPRR